MCACILHIFISASSIVIVIETHCEARDESLQVDRCTLRIDRRASRFRKRVCAAISSLSSCRIVLLRSRDAYGCVTRGALSMNRSSNWHLTAGRLSVGKSRAGLGVAMHRAATRSRYHRSDSTANCKRMTRNGRIAAKYTFRMCVRALGEYRASPSRARVALRKCILPSALAFVGPSVSVHPQTRHCFGADKSRESLNKSKNLKQRIKNK